MKDCYLGVDIGSISTKGVIIDDDNNIITSAYIWTEGNPVMAIRNLISALNVSTWLKRKTTHIQNARREKNKYPLTRNLKNYV